MPHNYKRGPAEVASNVIMALLYYSKVTLSNNLLKFAINLFQINVNNMFINNELFFKKFD